MKYILSAAFIFAVASAMAQQVFHDKDAKVRNVGSFSSIEVSSAIELQLSQGAEDGVAVSAENPDAIKTEVSNGRLRIAYEQKKWFNNRGKVRVYVSAKSLNSISASGASEVVVNGLFTAGSLSVRMSGASDFKGEVKAKELEVNLSGASDITIKGSASDLKVEASGASHLKGYDLVTDNCMIRASGASDVQLTANKAISAQASGASSINYKGTGQEGEIRSSGASSISKRG